jgi:hypothetical protein
MAFPGVLLAIEVTEPSEFEDELFEPADKPYPAKWIFGL